MANDWIQVNIYTKTQGLELLGLALHDIGQTSLVITDAADFESFLEGKFGDWDYIDQRLMKLREVETMVTVYLPNDRQGREDLATILEMLEQLKASDKTGELGRLECTVANIEDEDWDTAWCERHKPFTVGKKLMIRPPWGECEPGGRLVISIDPGMAFGNGTDETTRMCLEMLEETVSEGCSVLDIGCGSGILAIGALLLGADLAVGIDHDPVALTMARQNAARSGVSERLRLVHGNLADDVPERFDIVCANLSADVLISLAPESARLLNPGGLLILSGIIKNREQDVLDAFKSAGFAIRRRKEENGWICLLLVRLS